MSALTHSRLTFRAHPLRARTALARIARPKPLPPLTDEQATALVRAVNAARRHGPSAVTVESDGRGGIKLTRPEVEYVAGLELAAERLS